MKSRHIFSAILNLLRSGQEQTHYIRARNLIEFRIEIKKLGADIFLMATGILSAGFGLKGFLLPNKFLDGGATGISLLITELDRRKSFFVVDIG